MENEENLENQEPESKKGKKTKTPKVKKEGAISLPIIIGAAVGAVLLITASVIVGTIVASNIFGVNGSGGATKEEIAKTIEETLKKEQFEASREGKTPAELDSIDAAKMAKMHDMLTFETGKIISNPKGSASVYIVLELAIDFRIYNQESEKAKEMVTGEGEQIALNPEAAIFKKLKTRTTSKINDLIANYSVTEFQTMRPDLKNIIRTQLRPVFNDFELQLGEVQIITFMIQ